MAPLLSWALRMAGRGARLSDDFNRTLSGSLGQMSVGSLPWSIVTGTWDVNGTRPTTATSQSSNPLAVVNPGPAIQDIELTLGAGDALYFRVQDATNWWRVLWDGYQTSSCQQCCSTCCSTCCDTCNGVLSCCVHEGPQSLSCGGCGSCNGDCPFPPCGVCIGSGSTATCCSCYFSQGNCTYSCNCYSCNCYSCNCTSCNCTYYDNYRLVLQKMIGGTLTTVQTGTAQQGSAYATTRAHVSLGSGGVMSAYYGQQLLATRTEAELATETKSGIGRGASSYNVSALDDFQVSF